MKESYEEMSERIKFLERKFSRQKAAREAAEKQLDDFSWVIFKANSHLKLSLEESELRAQDLSFLHEMSSIITNQESIDEMVTNILPVLLAFTNADKAAVLLFNNGRFVKTSLKSILEKDKGWIPVPTAVKSKLASFSPNKANKEHWTLETIDKSQAASLSMSFNTHQNEEILIILIGMEENFSKAKLYTLSTACGQLLTGIKRRINDAILERRAKELEAVLANLREAQAQLVQSEKMASLGQLAAGVAHEINNPIGFIRSNLQVLQDYVKDYNDFLQRLNQLTTTDSIKSIELSTAIKDFDVPFICSDSLQIIDSNLQGINRVGEIVQSLRTFSHSKVQTFEKISLYDVINSALKVVANPLKYLNDVQNLVSPEMPMIEANFSQIQQVFVNLFINAAQAMPEGGILKVISSVESKHIIIEVTDNGIGMDEETSKNIFTPFFTTKRVGEGTGLGMSISYAILEAHHIEISIESVLNEGTTFRLKFPQP